MLNREKELLVTLQNVANENNIQKEVLFDALSEALRVSILKHIAEDADIEVCLNRTKATYIIVRKWLVVEAVTNSSKQISLEQARLKSDLISLGDTYSENLNIQDFGRIAINAGKKVISHIIKSEKSKKILEEINREFQIIQGKIIHIHDNRLTVYLFHYDVEATLPISELLSADRYRINDIVRACVIKSHILTSGDCSIILSRRNKNFLYALMRLEIPEISEHIVEVKTIARDPGIRAKIAVDTTDKRLDPVGSCIGFRGKRIQTISKELQNENLDIIKWAADPVEFTINAFSGTKINSITKDEVNHTMMIYVDKEHVSRAIGIQGVNSALISELVGWNIKIISSNSERETLKRLNLTDNQCKALFMHRIVSLNDLLDNIDKVQNILGCDDDTLESIQEKAQLYTLLKVFDNEEKLPVDTIPGMTQDILTQLSAHQIDTLQQLVMISFEEFKDICHTANIYLLEDIWRYATNKMSIKKENRSC